METENNTLKPTIKCLNCGTEFQGNYCPECGQSAQTRRYIMKSIFDDLRSTIAGTGGNIWFTFKSLFTQPGKMVVDFIDGKRIRYQSPISMLLLVTTLYILILSFTNGFDVIKSIIDSGSVASENAVDTEKVSQGLTTLFLKGVDFLRNHYAFCFFVTLPLYVVAARVCYGKSNRKRYNWAEYTIPIIYSMVIVILYRCVIRLVPQELTFLLGVFVTPIVVVMAFSACFRKMIGFNKVITIFLSILTSVLYYIMMLGVIFIIAFIAASILSIKYHP